MTNDEAVADMNRQIAAAKKKLKQKAALVESNTVQTVTNICIRVESEYKRLMRATYTAISYTNPKTDRLVVNKRPRSIPGAPPAPDNGTLMRSITHDVEVRGSEVTGRVGSTIQNPPYPEYLENGTSKMAARPALLPALDMVKRTARGAFVAAVKSDSAIAEITPTG
jgi:hypothetical protein